MKYFGFEGVIEALQHSFQWRLVVAIKRQLFMLLLLLVMLQYIGIQETQTLLEIWVFKPMSSLWILCGTITADWLSGAFKGFKSKEGFVTKKATQIGGKIFFNVLFFAILFNVSEHMIKPIVPNSVNINIILISIVLILAVTHLLSFAKNLAMVGYMPRAYVRWLSDKVDKYKDTLQEKI
jgi:hypothetical protein